MKFLMKLLLPILGPLIFFLLTSDGLTHPGKRSRDDCHFCRANCARWGVAWNQRHCHEADDRVVQVIDGDTVLLSNREKVRLLGIDSPEKGWKEKGIKKECFSNESTRFLEERVLGKRVTIELDSKGDKRDKHGRTLAYLYRDGSLINAELLKKGYALALTSFPFSKKKEFRGYQEEARVRQLGLWGACDVSCKGSLCKIQGRR